MRFLYDQLEYNNVRPTLWTSNICKNLIISNKLKIPHLVRWTVTVCCRSEIAPFLLISATFFDVLIFYNVIASFNSNFMWFAPWDSILDVYHGQGLRREGQTETAIILCKLNKSL